MKIDRKVMEGYHRSVLKKEVLEYTGDLKDGWFLDCTLGDGGHSLEVLKKGQRIIGLDVDPQALARAEARFEENGIGKNEYRLIKGNFRNLKNLINEQTDPPALAAHKALPAGTAGYKIKAVLFDLGVSSLQLLDPERGFSFLHEGPLDMRMDPDLDKTALDLIKTLKKGELEDVFNRLGEEKYSKRIADAVAGSSGVIKKTTDLARIVESRVGRSGKIPAKGTGRHPATRIFQALRIVVNDELNALVEGLDQAIEVIEGGGRIEVISFHSLEDRIVKNTFIGWEDEGKGLVLTKKPLDPSFEEVEINPRSRSAKLRVFEKRI